MELVVVEVLAVAQSCCPGIEALRFVKSRALCDRQGEEGVMRHENIIIAIFGKCTGKYFL